MSQCETLSIIICSHQPKPCPPWLYELPNKVHLLTTRTFLYYPAPSSVYSLYQIQLQAFSFKWNTRATQWTQRFHSSCELLGKAGACAEAGAILVFWLPSNCCCVKWHFSLNFVLWWNKNNSHLCVCELFVCVVLMGEIWRRENAQVFNNQQLFLFCFV